MADVSQTVFCGGLPLAQASGDMADALSLLILLRAQGASLRVSHRAPWVEPRPGTGHIECMTSGSRGRPKVIRRTYASWEGSFEVNRKLFALSARDRAAVFGTLGHSLALYGVLEALHAGACVEVLAGMRPDHQADRLAQAGVSVLYATPTQLKLLPAERIIRDVRLILCGGGALDRITADRVSAVFPNAALREFYGASETSFITLSDEHTPQGSVGRVYPGVEIEIRDATNGVGEVWVKSPYLFEGYAEGESAETRRDGDLLTVGELGRQDGAGYLWLAGRTSRMVTIADKNVYPEEIERVLAEALGERVCAVVARRDPLRGNVLFVFVEGHKDDDEERRLRQQIRDDLGPEMVPRRFVYLDPFPLLASGKPDLGALEKRVA
ncbi:long-chain acyl-CoA synthetase [Breoghania corrubedonensis]|uniref:Long-chain acyl-CoA synthetase n=1 Tax=Breoghania corrubedonensis TaxID=665038 RepID=A0A2T5V4N1_9HYPH|nr:AMP-binding protein [Breoghania corrubedonensis]PTW58708.1 long-chain acyl-CoA synthetase [Breoghania corrubedonensis]